MPLPFVSTRARRVVFAIAFLAASGVVAAAMAAQPSGGSACSLHNSFSTVAGQNNAEYVACASIANDTTSGTTTGKLAKLTSTGKAVITSTSDTDGVIGVVTGATSEPYLSGSVASTSGNADIAVAGTAACVFDGATTAGNYVTISGTTAGACTDAGSSRSTTKQTIGRVLSTNASAGTYDIVLDKAALNAAGGAHGSTGYVQFNTSGALNSDSNLFWDNTNKRLGIGTTSPTGGTLHVFVSSGNGNIKVSGDAGTANSIGYVFDSTARAWQIGAKGSTESGALFVYDQTAAQRRVTIDSSGNFGIGIAAGYPVNSILSLGGNAARTIGMERGTVAATAGYGLTLQAGGATSGSTNKSGGDLVLSSGTATGTGSSGIAFNTHPAGSTGTTDTTATTAMTITGAGKVGIGTTNPAAALEVATSSTGQPRGVVSALYSTDAAAPTFYGRKARGTTASPTAVANGDYLSALYAQGYDGSAYSSSGSLAFQVNGVVASGSVPTDFVVLTGTANPPTEKMRVTSSGNVGIGTTTVNATLDVNGYAKLATNAAQPVACSATYKGSIAMTSTTNYLCYCDGTSWKQVHSPATACTW